MGLDYNNEKLTKVMICGIECDFSDIRIDRNAISVRNCQYEVAGDDDSGGDLARVQHGVLLLYDSYFVYLKERGTDMF